MLRLTVLLLLCVLICPKYGDAADKVEAPTPAITVRDPAHTLLISITKVGTRLIAVGGHGVIVYSDDNGEKWWQAGVPVSTTITSAAFATQMDGWAVGAQGIVLHTADGGKTWAIQLNGTQANTLMLAASQQFAAQNPATPEASRIMKRAHILVNAGPAKPFLTVLAFSEQKVMVFGGDRMCDKSEDGGKTWVDCSLDIQDTISHNLYAQTTLGNTIYLVGEAGSVFQSNDGGLTFVPTVSPADSTLFGVIAIDASDILTFGVGGQVYESSDRAKSWQQSDISTSSDLTSGTVLRSGKVLIISEAGEIFLRSKRGGSFIQLPLNEGMALFDVAQAVNGNVVFVGSNGIRVENAAAFN